MKIDVHAVDNITLKYEAHVQTKGWLGYVAEGKTAGTTGQNLRLEAFRMTISGNSNLGISYSAYQQTTGWQSAKTSGQIAGSVGEQKRIEAIKINLTGSDASKYDIYYRVHSQTYGWLGWTKNGEIAGSTGLSKMAQAFEVKIVKKGTAAPGTTKEPYIGFKDMNEIKNIDSSYYQGTIFLKEDSQIIKESDCDSHVHFFNSIRNAKSLNAISTGNYKTAFKITNCAYDVDGNLCDVRFWTSDYSNLENRTKKWKV